MPSPPGNPRAIVFIDGQNVTASMVEDDTNTYLYFTYNFQSTCSIMIRGRGFVPEFSSSLLIAAFLAITVGAAVAIRKTGKKIKTQNRSRIF